MNTPAHLLLGTAAFSRPDSRATNVCAIVGSLLPDLSLYVMASYALYVQQISPRTVFGELYFSEEWQGVFAIDNSLFVWLLIVLAGLLLKKKYIVVLGAAGILHIATDLPLHHDDGRPHFWPFSDWVFESPISYWDTDHYGGFVGPAETVLSVVLCVLLIIRFKSWLVRGLVVLMGLLEVVPNVLFAAI